MVLLDQTPLHLDREGIKEGEGSERGWGQLIEGDDYFKYFCLRRVGGGGRAIIIRGKQLIGMVMIQGNIVLPLALT